MVSMSCPITHSAGEASREPLVPLDCLQFLCCVFKLLQIVIVDIKCESVYESGNVRYSLVQI